LFGIAICDIITFHQMVRAHIIYGFQIKEEDIIDFFPDDKYPQLYAKNVCEELVMSPYFEFSQLKDLINLTKLTSLYFVDFEYSNTYDEGGTTLIVGIQLNECEAHYNGVMEVTKVDSDIEESIALFVRENPTFGGMDAKLYVYVDAEK
jgi:hypothetical protein